MCCRPFFFYARVHFSVRQTRAHFSTYFDSWFSSMRKYVRRKVSYVIDWLIDGKVIQLILRQKKKTILMCVLVTKYILVIEFIIIIIAYWIKFDCAIEWRRGRMKKKTVFVILLCTFTLPVWNQRVKFSSVNGSLIDICVLKLWHAQMTCVRSS